MRNFLSVLLAGLYICMLPMAASADESRIYRPAIWIDPDGCEHWVLDLGIEGMMSPHMDRDGLPVCNRNPDICMEFPGDTLFAVNEAELSADAVSKLRSFFTQQILSGQTKFLVVGHTDSDGSLYDNFDLAWDRANAVANVAQQSGAIVRSDAFGELQPIATNDTAAGKSRNRRVEIMCE